MHSIVSIPPVKRSMLAIHVVDTIIHDNDRVAILNRDFVGRWRKYEAFLGPLFAELEPFTGSTAVRAKPQA